MNVMKQEDLKLEELSQYYGTLNYHNVMGVNVTDGVKYVMENGYSWLVTDMIVSMKMKQELKQESFLCVKLLLNGTKAQAVITDGNENVLYEQKYDFTDAKKEFKMFFCNDVLMLSGEY